MHPETLDVLRGGPVWRYAIPSDGPLHEQTYSVGHAVDPVARRVFGLPVRVDVETRPGVVVLETYTERDTNNHHPEAR